MFGFLRAQVEELKVRDHRLLESYYCGLCCRLGKRYGTLMRSLRNCDSTFYALLADAQSGAPLAFRKALCPQRPYLRIRPAENEASLQFGAALAVMMLATKLGNQTVEGEGLKFWTANFLIQKTLDKAKQDLDACDFSFEWILKEWAEQKDIQERGNPGMELSARPTATVIAKVFEHTAVMGRAEENREICKRIGYAVGELIFLTDHFLSYKEDAGKGRFNALVEEAKARGEPVEGGNLPEPVRNRCRELCFERMNRVKTDAWALKLKQHEEIIRNVLEQGFPQKVTHIFTCRDPGCKEGAHQPPTFAKFPFSMLE